MKTSKLLIGAFSLMSSAVLFSCKKEAAITGAQSGLSSSLTASGTGSAQLDNNFKVFGTSVQMGNGAARTWMSLSKDGAPVEFGISLSKNAVTNLPEDHDEATFVLPVPQKAKDLTPFDHIAINWNVHGHAPFFYQLPHFDFHFYMMSLAERLAIPSYADAPAGFDNNPPAGYLPATYIAPPGGEEEQMGKHWVDATAPELPWNGGATFTKSFIYGSYNGAVKFFEPMVTLATIEGGTAQTAPIPQPVNFSQHKYYPTVYNIYTDNGSQTYNITLSSFIQR